MVYNWNYSPHKYSDCNNSDTACTNDSMTKYDMTLSSGDGMRNFVSRVTILI